MPYADPERHRRNSRDRYWRKRSACLRLAWLRYHHKIGTWTARKLGMTIADYDRALKRQRRRCAICRRKETLRNRKTRKTNRLGVDHSHKTGLFRGLLCRRCNTAIALFDDDVQRLKRAIAYLTKE